MSIKTGRGGSESPGQAAIGSEAHLREKKGSAGEVFCFLGLVLSTLTQKARGPSLFAPGPGGCIIPQTVDVT